MSQQIRLLLCGAVAGPVFLAIWAAQAFTRDGFDPMRHPISLLSLGGPGWIQLANFVLAGVLCVAFAAGLRQVWGAGWLPVALHGAGLIIAGVFTTDPGAGFPQGAPAGAPEHISWHGILHEAGFVCAAVSWLAACVVLARRFGKRGERGRAAGCLAVLLTALALPAWPDADTFALRLLLGTAVQFAFLSAVALRAIRDRERVDA